MNWELIRSTLARLIEQGGWTHNTLAVACGVAQPTISRFMSGEHASLSLDNLKPIADALGVQVGELIGEKPLIEDDDMRRTMKVMQDSPEYRSALRAAAEAMAAGPQKKRQRPQ